MLSKDTRLKIRAMNEDQSIGQEIINRLSLLQKKPQYTHQVEAILKNLDTSKDMNSKIEATFRSKMANYDHGSCGDDIASSLNEIPEILQNALDYKPGKKTRDTIDKIEFEALALALSGIDAARDFESAYDTMLASLTDLTVKYQERSELKETKQELPIEVLIDAKQDRVHEEKITIRKRIVFRKQS